jgi:hypothetical protein
MINERIALVMLDGKVPNNVNDPHHTKQFYKSIQSFANISLRLCEEGKFKKLETFLKVALKLFKDGNATVKNGIVNVYLYTLSHALDKQSSASTRIDSILPKELRLEYTRQHYTSGM